MILLCSKGKDTKGILIERLLCAFWTLCIQDQKSEQIIADLLEDFKKGPMSQSQNNRW
jgi:hypothetical protein